MRSELLKRIHRIGKILKGANTPYIMKDSKGNDYVFTYDKETLEFLRNRRLELIEQLHTREAKNEG